MRSRVASGMAGILILLMLACNLPINQTPVNNDIPLSSPIVESVTLSPSLIADMPPAIGTDVIGPDEETILPAITHTLKPSLTTSAVTITSTEDTNCRKGSGGDV